MEAKERYVQLRSDLLQACSISERLRVLAKVRSLLKSLPQGEATRPYCMLLLAIGYAEPVCNWKAVLTYAAATIHAIPALDAERQMTMRPYVALARGIALSNLGRHAQAIVELEEGEKASGNAGVARHWRIRSLLAMGRISAARRLVDSFPHIDAEWDGPVGLSVAAMVLEAEGRYSEARVVAMRAIPALEKLGATHHALDLHRLYLLLARCADKQNELPARRTARVEATRLALSTCAATQARQVLHRWGIGGDTFDEARVDYRRSERTTSSACSGIPSNQLRGKPPDALLTQQVRARRV